jgi:Protein of unknown function (DUF2459)
VPSLVDGAAHTAPTNALPTSCNHGVTKDGTATAIVVRRGWHIDIGFAVTDLELPLCSIAANLPAATFIFFGFGDMHYLMSKHHGSSTLSAALWPGAGIMLVTGLAATPQQGFGPSHVVELNVTALESRQLQSFIWNSFAISEGRAAPYHPGPYEDSFYYLALPHYSALHTCNTWAARALHAAGLPIRSSAVWFAGQLWGQVRRLQKQRLQTWRRAPQLQGGLVPS